tara:strand:- start:22 stop:1602 length:1581 start_codon:yes stop_codon:yes gene_type:complete
MALTQISTKGIKDGTIINADVAASAAIAGTKISPDFGSQNILTTGQLQATAQIPAHFKRSVTGTSPVTVLVGNNTHSFAFEASSSGFSINDYTNTNTERLFINTSGVVSIGTTSPSASASKLQVEHSGENNVYFVGNTSTSGARLILQNKNTTANSFTGLLGADAGGQTTSQILFYNADNANNEGYMTFETRPSGGLPAEAMRITSSGAIIASNASGYHADADDLVLKERSGGNVGINLLNTTAGYGVIYFGDSSSNNAGRIQYDHPNNSLDLFTAGSERMVINSSGEVGIGTTSPDDKLVLSGSTGSGLKVIDGTHIGVFRTFSEGAILKTASNHRFAFGTNDTERVSLSTKGGINTLFNDGDSVAVVHKRVQSTNSHNFFEIRSNGSTPLSGGNLQFAIETDGDVKNTNNSYGSLSDVKLKENIVDAKSQWDDIKALKVRNYNFKSGLDFGTYTQIGLIAQEVEEISAGLVVDNIDRDDEGKDLGTVTKTLRYSVLHIKALKALQEAMTKIEVLETEVAALKAS